MLNRNRRVASVLLAAVVGVTSLSTGSVTVSAGEIQGQTAQEYINKRDTENFAGAVESHGKGSVYDDYEVDSDYVYGDYKYKIKEDNTIEIIKYIGTEKDIVIPAEIDGRNVTDIGDRAFMYYSRLSSIEIPNSITGIGDYAFYYCESLVSIVIPESVTSIGLCAFSGCSSLGNIVISGNVANIGGHAFSDCSNLTEITVEDSNPSYCSKDGILYTRDMTKLIQCPGGKQGGIEIPEGVTNIEPESFADCSSLSSITISGSVANIGQFAFSGCSSLVSIEIPESVTNMDQGILSGCNRLTEIIVEDSNPSYCSKDGILYTRDMVELVQYPGGKQGGIEIPESVTSIRNYAFSGCSSLDNIEIPKTVTDMGYGVFSGCSSLVSVEIPKTVTSIKIYTFMDCSSLDNIELPETVTDIQEGAFSGCSSLSNVRIPEGVTNIANTAFADCSSLSSIEIPGSVTGIGDYAFKNCSSLGSIELPESVASIGDYAFFGCSSLVSMKLPESVASIGIFAFSDCSSLSSIAISGSVANIGQFAFADCSEELTLFVEAGSYAENYAAKMGIKYRYLGECVHNYTSKVTTNPTCTAEGVKIYTCTKCNDSYQVKLPAIGHTWKTAVTPASTKKEGSIVKKCTKCGEQKSKTTICVVKTIKLSKTIYTYNSKVLKPSVSIQDSKGRALKLNTDYTVSYPKGMKNVGSYTVTVKFKGNYKGTEKKTFTITPQPTSISKVTAKSKGFTVKWKKQASQTTGYEIAYSTSSKFKKAAKTVTVSKNKTISKSVSKLKAKKKYYVRIRTYKTVKVNGKSTKIYSDWSEVKTVTTKK